ncbi:MAG: polysaccharide deacetylase family protein [Candidatus Onthomonas sp.]
MNQRELEQSYEEVRRRNRRRRRARQRRRRQRQILHLSIALVLCCFLVTGGRALYRYVAGPEPQAAEETSDSPEGNPQNLQDPQESQTQSDITQPEMPPEPETPPVEIDPNSIIYLTFDDGPSDSTARILDILKENNIHATFFIVNYSADRIPLLQRMIDEGHTIGIHAYTHDYEVCYGTNDAYIDGVEKLQDKLENDIGYDAFCLRFPGGSSNTISRNYNEGIMSRLAIQVENMGLEYYDWNVDSGDASGNHVPDATLVSNTTGELIKGRSNIVLMHDAETKDTTIQALQSIINYGVQNGYHFEAIDRNTPPVHHQINN